MAGSAGKGWPQQRFHWGLCACAGMWMCTHRHTGSLCGEQLKKLQPPVQSFEGGKEFRSCSVPHNFSSWKIRGYMKRFFCDTQLPVLQIYRSSEICMLLLDYDSVFQGSRSRLSLLPLLNLFPTLSSGGWEAMRAVSEEISWAVESGRAQLRMVSKINVFKARETRVCENLSSSWYRSRTDTDRMALNLKKIKRNGNRQHLESYRKEL